MIKSISKELINGSFIRYQLNNNFSSLITQKQSIRYKYKFQYGIGFRPHPNKQYYGGDDYHLAQDNILAVADGVGAWTQSQYQPSIYASRIIEFVKKIYKNQKKMTIQNPIYAARQALRLVKTAGATTLTILTLHPQTGQLKSYYIGDSIYGFFKKQEVQMTTAQMISFNKPYQIGQLNQQIQNGYQNDYSLKQIRSDLILIATDGLWDNLSLDRIHYQCRGPGSILKNDQQKNVKQIAQSIADLAYRYSLSQNYNSPIYIRAKQQGLQMAKQGKVDDITLILAQIVKQTLKKGQSYF